MGLRTLFLNALVLTLGSSASFAQTLPPEAEVRSPLMDAVTHSVAGDTSSQGAQAGDYELTVQDADKQVVGFNFTNTGGNRVVPPKERGIGMGPDRQFSFVFPRGARQDIHLELTDIPNEFLSQMMESYFYFFPRTNLPAIIWPAADASDQTVQVILPTGEMVKFDPVSKQMTGGVLAETAPIDLNPNRFNRKFAAIAYSGTGVVVRVDTRGADPRLGTVATVQKGAQTCKVPSKLLFNQDPESDVEFLFATDADFNAFLIKQCKMSFL